MDELAAAGVVKLEDIVDDNGNVIDQKVIVYINEEDGLSKDEIDAMMCVSTGNPTLLSFGAETVAHATIYNMDKPGIKRMSTIKSDSGVVENKKSNANEYAFKDYYGEDSSVGKGYYILEQEWAFGDSAYEYIDGYSE